MLQESLSQKRIGPLKLLLFFSSVVIAVSLLSYWLLIHRVLILEGNDWRPLGDLRVRVNDLLVAPNGDLWAATGNGLAVYQNGRWIHLRSSEWLDPDEHQFAATAKGIWAATGNQIAHYDGNTLRRYALNSSAIETIAASRDNAWAIDKLKVLYYFDGERWSDKGRIPDEMRLGKRESAYLVAVSNGGLWLYRKQLWRMEQENWKEVPIPDKTFVSMEFIGESNGRAWFAERAPIQYTKKQAKIAAVSVDTGDFQTYDLSDLDSSLFDAPPMFLDERGRFIVLIGSALMIRDGSRWTQLRQIPALPADYAKVSRIKVLPNGTIIGLAEEYQFFFSYLRSHVLFAIHLCLALLLLLQWWTFRIQRKQNTECRELLKKKWEMQQPSMQPGAACPQKSSRIARSIRSIIQTLSALSVLLIFLCFYFAAIAFCEKAIVSEAWSITAILIVSLLFVIGLLFVLAILPMRFIMVPLALGRYQAAYRRARAVAYLVPAVGDELFANVLNYAGKYAEAEQVCAERLRVRAKGTVPGTGAVLAQYGRALTGQRRFEEAENVLLSLVNDSFNEGRTDAALFAAELYLEQKVKPEDALALSEYAMNKKANSFLHCFFSGQDIAYAYSIHAWALTVVGQTGQAPAMLVTAAKFARGFSPELARIEYVKLRIELLRQNIDKAIEHGKKAMELDPDGALGTLAKEKLAELKPVPKFA